MSTTPRGALIVIEGLDRAGKSTQHARLCQYLESQGRNVKRMRFPGMYSTIPRFLLTHHLSNVIEQTGPPLLASQSTHTSKARINKKIM